MTSRANYPPSLQPHARLPSSQPHDHCVYLRVFEGCNLHCQHCFIPSNPKRMTLDDIAALPETLADRIPPGSRVLLQWHGGEPTLMGVDFIRAAIDRLNGSGAPYTWIHGIQTNLMTYDADWRALYEEHFGSEVGVSWDPKIRLLNRRALDSNPAFNARFDARLAQLVQDGLTPYVVVTATKTLFKAFPNPFDFFEHWRVRGVRHVHLERVTPTGYARQNWDFVGLTNHDYAAAMSRWARAYSRYKSSLDDPGALFLSPIDSLSQSVSSLLEGAPQPAGCWSGACDTRFHTVDASGYKRGCTALTSEDDNRASNHRPDYGADLRETRRLRTFDCARCPFKSICSSGCLALDFDDGSGECSGGYSLFKNLAEISGHPDAGTISARAPEVSPLRNTTRIP